MSNFRLLDPDAVLIHVPKNAGTSVRKGVWSGRYDGPVFGHIPTEWRGLFKFAFVRHPLDRLLSAWRMFTTEGSKMKATSLSDFLDVVTDDSIPFDYSGLKRTAGMRIRHHTIPQTHPFNCLDKADFVGRHERFGEDFAAISKRLGRNLPSPPVLNTSAKNEERFDAPSFERAIAYYRDDFRELDYRTMEAFYLQNVQSPYPAGVR